MERLQGIYTEAGRPSARVLRTKAARAGVQITAKQAAEFVRGQPEAQLLAPRLKSDGHITASRDDVRWMVDLVDFSKRRAQEGGWRFALVVTDVHSRYTWTERLRSKEAMETLSAFRKVVRANGNRAPREVVSDRGREWTGMDEYLAEKDAVHTFKRDQQPNAIAIVDRSIQSLKAIIAKLQIDTDQGWSQLLKKAEDILNSREHSSLMGASPEDVAEDTVPVVEYELEKEAGEKMRKNNEAWRNKTEKLRSDGGFREMRKRSTWPRIDEPRYKEGTNRVGEFKGANVTNQQGESFPVKDVLPVRAESEDIVPNEELFPNSGRREAQKRALGGYAQQLKDAMAQTAWSFPRTMRFIKGLAAFDDTAEVYRLPKAGRYIKFLRLFSFRIEGSGVTMQVRAPPTAPRVAAVRRGPDIEARAPRRGMAGSQRIRFGENKKRFGTAAFARYERYKSATTVQEARDLGMTPMDLRAAIQSGQGELL
jgi:transposase InsO family protein